MRILTYFWLAAAIGVFAVACGGDDDDDKTNTPAPTPTPSSENLSLSSSFETNCSTCHPDCKAASGADLSGTSLTLEQYKDKIRNGVAGTAMDSFSSNVYSDEDLENDYEFCKAE